MTPARTKELLPLIKAYSEGITIEYRKIGNVLWTEMEETVWPEGFDYRIKPEPEPEPKLIPFTFEDRQYFKNLWVKSKEHDTLNSLVQISKDDVLMTYGVKNIRVTYSQLLKHYEFEDNSPCGKYINE